MIPGGRPLVTPPIESTEGQCRHRFTLTGMAAPAHLALRYLLRSSSALEVTTNDLLAALLVGDSSMHAGFLEAVGQLAGRDLRGCRIERESYLVDPDSGARSFRDFRISRAADTPVIIETKVDSGLTSSDQASRYFKQLDDDGLLVLVTRAPLVPSLASQVAAQLGADLDNQHGVHHGTIGGREIRVLSWTRLLRSVVTTGGDPFDELLALDAAIEGITDFVPFTTAVQDTAVGQTISQVAGVAHSVCEQLAERLVKAGVQVDSVSRVKSNGSSVWVNITILEHQMWVGYDAAYWATVPGDPARPETGAGGVAPSPFWVNRWTNPTRRSIADQVEARRKRLDSLGAGRPLPAPLGAPRDTVVETILTAAVEHLHRISDALHADPSAATATSVGASEDPEDVTGDGDKSGQ